MATPPETVDARRNISGAQAALIILGLLVLLVVLWFLFLRGGGEEVEEQPIQRAVPTTAPADPEEEDAPDRRKGPVESFAIFAPKDPFDPLITTGTAGGGAVTGGEGVVDGGGDGTGGDGRGDGRGDGVPRGRGESIGGHTVRLIDVFEEGGETRAQIQVDGTVYTVSEGQVFADNFQLVSTNGDCATILFGDDQFTLCEGEEILK